MADLGRHAPREALIGSSGTLRAAVALAALAALTSSTVAVAARAPTRGERAAIVRALPKNVRDAPVECLWLRIRVSDGGRFAKVDPETMNAERPGSRCLRYAGDGFFVLRKKRAWRVVYVGSDPPPCSLRFPRGLVRCLR